MPIFTPPGDDYLVQCPRCSWLGPVNKADNKPGERVKCPECCEYVEKVERREG